LRRPGLATLEASGVVKVRSDPPLTLDTSTLPSRIVVSSGEVGDEVAAYIAGYEPSRAIRSWVLIAAFVRHVVLTIAPETPGAAQRYLSLLAAYINWCVLSEGTTPTDRLLTDARVRAFFKEWGQTRSARWVAASRLRFDELLHRYHDQVSLSAQVGGPHGPRNYPPYNDQEIARIFSWARSRRGQRTHRNATAVTLLGLGFGLRASDMVRSTRDFIVDNGTDGLEITLPDRAIWCESVHENDLRTLLGRYELAEPLLTYPTATHLTRFLTRERQRSNRTTALAPSISRMRATWLCRRATHVPELTAIMRSYGIQHISSLHSLIAFFPSLTPTEARRVSRTVTPERSS